MSQREERQQRKGETGRSPPLQRQGRGDGRKVMSAAGAAERRVLGLLVTSEVQTRGKGREGKVAGIWRLEGNRVWPRCPLLVGTSGWSGSRER